MPDIQDDIILAFKQGDRAAFNTIYLALRKPIITFCGYLVPADDAEDITADVFVKLWRSREQWDNIRNVKAFLYMSARNACFDFLKSQKRKNRREQQVAAIMEHEQEFIQQSQIEADLIYLIKKEVDSLPENCRKVFTMSFLQGYPNAEIAKELHITDKTVRNLKTIALNKIKKNLETKGLELSTLLILIDMIKRWP